MTDTERSVILDEIKKINHDAIELALKGEREAAAKANAELNGKMDAANARLDKLDKSNERLQTALAVGAGAHVEDGARIAFRDYLRTGKIQNAMTEGVASEGGVLVPPAALSELIHLTADANPLRELATVISINNPQYVACVRTGIGSGTVGVEGGVVVSGAVVPLQPTATPTFAKITIPALDMYSCQEVTRDLLMDAEFSIEDEVTRGVADQFGVIEASHMVNGSGGSSGEMQGLVGGVTAVANSSWTAGAGANVAYIAGGNASSLASPDALLEMQGSLDDRYQQNATWLMNTTTYNTLRTMKVGSGGSNAYLLWRPEIVGERFAMTLAGVPVRRVSTMPSIAANAFPVAYGDFRAAYRIVDRTGIIVIRDEVTAAPNIRYKVIKRTGAGVVNCQAYKLLKIAVS